VKSVRDKNVFMESLEYLYIKRNEICII
jgi:hypothetical protein